MCASNPCSHSIVGLDVQSLVSEIPYIGENVTEKIGQDAGSVSGFESSTACGTIALLGQSIYKMVSNIECEANDLPPVPLTLYTPY